MKNSIDTVLRTASNDELASYWLAFIAERLLVAGDDRLKQAGIAALGLSCVWNMEGEPAQKLLASFHALGCYAIKLETDRAQEGAEAIEEARRILGIEDDPTRKE